MQGYTCPKCNKYIKYGVNFCPHCGQKVVWEQSNDSNQENESKTDNDSGNGCLYGFIIFVIFSLVAHTCGDSDKSDKSDKSEKTASKTEQTSSVNSSTTDETAYTYNDNLMVGKKYSFTYNDIYYKVAFDDKERGTLYVDTNGSNIPLKFSYNDFTDVSGYVSLAVSDSQGILDAMGISTYLYMADGYIYASVVAAQARDTSRGSKCTMTK